jgi:hypothetical protein
VLPHISPRSLRSGSIFVGLGFLAAACTAPRLGGPGLASGPQIPPEPYVRVCCADSNLVQLQVALRRFAPARKGRPVVWLAGVSHIGDTNYNAAMQRLLGAQTLVLFEGISGPANQGPDAPDLPGAAAPTQHSAGGQSSLQSALAAALGLVFQLEAMDYDQPNFRNSDLTIPELRQLLARRSAASGTSGAEASFEGLLQTMQGDSLLDALVQMGLRLLGASPKLQAWGRLALIDVLDQIQGDPSRLGRLPPDLKQLLEVLLLERNRKVLADLRAALRSMGRRDSVAIFFGAGHMPDLEQRLRRDLRYHPAGQLWLTAFSVDLARAGISPPERQFIHHLVQAELQQFQPKP